MAVPTWRCDSCGKDTYIAPPTEPVMVEIEVDVMNPLIPGKTMKQKRKVQKTVRAKRMNPHTGLIEEYDAPMVRDLKPRAVPVRLQVDLHTYIQRDFCPECREKIQAEVQRMWALLESYIPK